MKKRNALIGAAVAVVAVAGVTVASGGADDYEVTLVMPSAAQLAKGSPVWIDGIEAGRVSSLDVRDGKAVVKAVVDEEYAPLHEGTTSRVEWKSALGERMLTLYPGPDDGSEIPDGGLIEAKSAQVEVDEILALLDKPTREHLRSLLGQLNKTVDGSEKDLQETIKSAGPALRSMGEVLAAIGSDGPAIKALVRQLNGLTGDLASRKDDVAGTVENLTVLSSRIAEEQEALSRSLEELPSTVRTATTTLGRLEPASDSTVPLLRDLEPSTARLGPVAKNLDPVLRELTPTLKDLRPLLSDARRLLGETPEMLDGSGAVLPSVESALTAYQPAISFLRPYTPELAGWLGNWGQNFAPYDSQGHVWAATLAPGTNAFNESLIRPPGAATSSKPYPGEVVGQPWTDANGSEMK